MNSEQDNGNEILLQEPPVVATLLPMKENEQVRVPTSLTGKARIVSQALHGESMPDYVARVLKEALDRDFPLAAKRISDLAAKGDDDDKPKPGRKKP